jgi:hypothetical protein
VKLFSRKGKAPDALVASTDAHVGGSARILAWAQTEDGYVVALPDRMLILRTGGPTEELGWHDILHGGFTEDGDLRWERMSTGDEGQEHLTDPQSFPETFRERVESTFLLQQVVTPFPGRHVTISARRNLMDPTERVMWTAHPARGTHMDGEILAYTEVELARLRAEYAF